MCSRVAETVFLSPVTTTEIDKLTLSLKDSAPGWDDITASLLKVSLDYITDPLCYLCNKSLQTGIFPAQLKIANVLPLYKAEDPFQFNNYIDPGYGLSLVDTLWNASSYRQPLEQEGDPMTWIEKFWLQISLIVAKK